jgi:hypothetical protein
MTERRRGLASEHSAEEVSAAVKMLVTDGVNASMQAKQRSALEPSLNPSTRCPKSNQLLPRHHPKLLLRQLRNRTVDRHSMTRPPFSSHSDGNGGRIGHAADDEVAERAGDALRVNSV